MIKNIEILFFIAYKCVDDIDCNLHGSCNKETEQCICDIGWNTEQDCSGRLCNNDFDCNNKETCDGLVCQCNHGWDRDALGDCSGNNFKHKSLNLIISALLFFNETGFYSIYKNSTSQLTFFLPQFFHVQTMMIVIIEAFATTEHVPAILDGMSKLIALVSNFKEVNAIL